MPSVNNVKIKGLNSGTTVQKTLKTEATTYFARIDIGADGSGSLVQSGGQSKGVLFFTDAVALASSGSYKLVYNPQEAWLGSPSVTWVSGGISATPANGEYFAGRVTVYEPSADVSAFGITGLTTGAVVAVDMYHISGSNVSEKDNPPSGSSIYITLVGTTSPVF